MTPLRAAIGGTDPVATTTPDMHTPAGPLGASFHWMHGQNYQSPNYTISPYGHHVSVNPHATPTQAAMQGMPTPYHYLPAAAYSWSVPYMPDTNYPHLAYMQSYGALSMHTGANVGDEVAGTPTRIGGCETGESQRGRGGNAT